MESIPQHLMFSTDHEWVEDLGAGRYKIGITDYAQDALGDVVFVSLPAIGATSGSGDSVGEVESTKSVSDLYAPISGAVVEVNDQLVEEPGLVNTDPYGAGWMWIIEGEANPGLLDAAAYQKLIS
jgi:glycine cleavage system H protein